MWGKEQYIDGNLIIKSQLIKHNKTLQNFNFQIVFNKSEVNKKKVTKFEVQSLMRSQTRIRLFALQLPV